MTRKTFIPALTIGTALLALAGPALPQSAPANAAGFAYSADGGTYTPTVISLRGRAEIVQGQNRLRANAIEATQGGGGVSRVEASGNVYFVTPDQSMRGDRAIYTPGNDEVVVTGDVILTQGRNVLTGNRIVYNTRTETARIEGGGGNGRIQGVFYPEGTN